LVREEEARELDSENERIFAVSKTFSKMGRRRK
jgi:hypothetical protein